MATQNTPMRRIDYIVGLTEMLCTGSHVSLSHSVYLDGKFTDSEVRLFLALRDVMQDENSIFSQKCERHIEFREVLDE